MSALRLMPGPSIVRNVAGTPRVISGAPPEVTSRINAALAKVDARGRASALQCRADLRKSGTGGTDSAWVRKVSVAFAGPLFLAVRIHDETYCGGPHPSHDDQALVYDLRSGHPVDWRPLFPSALRSQSVIDTAEDGARLGFFAMNPAFARLVEPQSEECKGNNGSDGMKDLHIMVWPDRSGSLVLGLRGFEHAIQSCEKDITLQPAQLQQMGFDQRLVDALSHPRR